MNKIYRFIYYCDMAIQYNKIVLKRKIINIICEYKDDSEDKLHFNYNLNNLINVLSNIFDIYDDGTCTCDNPPNDSIEYSDSQKSFDIENKYISTSVKSISNSTNKKNINNAQFDNNEYNSANSSIDHDANIKRFDGLTDKQYKLLIQICEQIEHSIILVFINKIQLYIKNIKEYETYIGSKLNNIKFHCVSDKCKTEYNDIVKCVYCGNYINSDNKDLQISDHTSYPRYVWCNIQHRNLYKKINICNSIFDNDIINYISQIILYIAGLVYIYNDSKWITFSMVSIIVLFKLAQLIYIKYLKAKFDKKTHHNNIRSRCNIIFNHIETKIDEFDSFEKDELNWIVDDYYILVHNICHNDDNDDNHN